LFLLITRELLVAISQIMWHVKMASANAAMDERWVSRSDSAPRDWKPRFEESFRSIFGYGPVWRDTKAYAKSARGRHATYEFQLGPERVTLVGTSNSVPVSDALDLAPLVAARMPQADVLVYTAHGDPMNKSYAYSAYIRGNTDSQCAETVCSEPSTGKLHTVDTGTNQDFYAPRTADAVLIPHVAARDPDVIASITAGAYLTNSTLRSKGYSSIFALEPLDDLADADCDSSEYGRYIRRLAVVLGMCQMLRVNGELHIAWPASQIERVSADIAANCKAADPAKPLYAVRASTTGVQSVMVVWRPEM
jgi:hypothetical protein